MKLRSIDAQTLKRRLDAGKALLIDVREAGEYAHEHIDGARLVPLSRFAVEDFGADRDKAADSIAAAARARASMPNC